MVTAIARLDDKKLKDLATILDEAEAAGAKVRDLFPQLNKRLIDAGPGSVMVGEVLDYKIEAAESDLNDEAADVVTLKDRADGARYNFFASNKGMKAKLRGLTTGVWLLVLYAGDVESVVKGHNAWHDFRFVEFKTEADAAKYGEAILEKLA